MVETCKSLPEYNDNFLMEITPPLVHGCHGMQELVGCLPSILGYAALTLLWESNNSLFLTMCSQDSPKPSDGYGKI